MSVRTLGALVIAVCAIGVIAAGVGGQHGDDDDRPAAAARVDVAPLPRLEPTGNGPAQVPEVQVGSGSLPTKEGVPRGLTAEQWQALQDSVKDHPRAADELARIVDFFSSKLDFEAFEAIRSRHPSERPDDRRLQEMARALLPKVDVHLQRGELSGGDAVALRAELLLHVEPDERRRAEDMAQWVARQSARVKAAAPTDPGFAAYRQAEEQLVAQYEALPPSQRDPAALARQLQALRFGEPTP